MLCVVCCVPCAVCRVQVHGDADAARHAGRGTSLHCSPFSSKWANKRDFRCVLHPTPSRAGCKTRLQSRIKGIEPHVIYDWCFAGAGAAVCDVRVLPRVHGGVQRVDERREDHLLPPPRLGQHHQLPHIRASAHTHTHTSFSLLSLSLSLSLARFRSLSDIRASTPTNRPNTYSEWVVLSWDSFIIFLIRLHANVSLAWCLFCSESLPFYFYCTLVQCGPLVTMPRSYQRGFVFHCTLVQCVRSYNASRVHG